MTELRVKVTRLWVFEVAHIWQGYCWDSHVFAWRV